MRPCPTAGREPSLSNCRKDIGLQGTHLLPLTCYGVWGELLALSVARFLVWEMGSSQCQPPQSVPKSREPNPGQRLSQTWQLPCQRHQDFSQPQLQEMEGRGLPGPALPKPPASAAWRTSCASTSSQMPRPPPPIARIVGSSDPWLPPPQPGPLHLRGHLLPWLCGATSGSLLFLCIPSSPIPSHPTPQGQPTHRTLLSRQEE